MDPILSVVLVVLAGTGLVYGPIALGSLFLRKSQLREAFKREPAQLPPQKRLHYAGLLFQEAVRAHQTGDHERAATVCRRVLRYDPEDAEASRLLVASLFAAGRFDESRDALERHLAANPEDEAAKLVRAAISCERGDLVQARGDLDDIDPAQLPTADRALWFNNYAFTLAGLEIDLDLALEYGERALELASPADRQYALRTLGVVHLARGEPEQALARLQEALRERAHLRPGDVEFTRYYLGEACLALGDTRAARDYLQQVAAEGQTSHAERAQALLEDPRLSA